MTDKNENIIRLTKADAKAAARTLARAFQDYPVSVFIEPDAVKREKEQPGAFRSVMVSAMAHGEIYSTSPRMEGVAIWVKGDKNRPVAPPRRSAREWLGSLFGDKGKQRRRQAFFNFSNEIRARLLFDRYWYLQMLGVDPAHQGKGYSGRLLKPMLARAEREGLPVYLETQLEKNVSLYQHFGFKVVEEGVIPGSDVYSWAMVRDVKKG